MREVVVDDLQDELGMDTEEVNRFLTAVMNHEKQFSGARDGDGEQTTDTTTAIVAGNGDPGYGATSKLLAELGLCLAFDEHDSSCLEGGVLTPSTAVGKMYVERLRQCDFMTAVEIVVNGKKIN